MSVRVLYFGSLREKLGKAEDLFRITDGNITAREVWTRLNHGQTLSDNTLIAINMAYVKANARVRSGDELAFFPPITGG